ncbi:hypothetical protein ACFW1A_30990 [Kitasatospora sp. NPDC058965]|uniref:hypothetical protein n=1 Tax=Kitasatospora sp. NPDC058965 TaxID=3346682 RepID=UPI00369AE1A7
MPSAVLTRTAARLAAAALACATTVSGTGLAVADDHHHAEPVRIRIDKSGISSPEQAQGGLVTFRTETDDPNGRQLQILRPHEGVSIDQVFADLAKAVNQTDPATAAAGITAVRGESDALGGQLVTPAVPEEQTERIGDGTLYLLDFTAFLADPAHPVFRTLQLCGDNGRELAAFPQSIVLQHETSDGPRFDAQNLDTANAPILVHNEADELHEMQIQPVAPGTTDADVQAFFDALANGQNPGPPPFTGPPSGVGAISPNGTVELKTQGLAAGTYVLLCFVPDDQTGIPHAFEGMHKVVVLN